MEVDMITVENLSFSYTKSPFISEIPLKLYKSIAA